MSEQCRKMQAASHWSESAQPSPSCEACPGTLSISGGAQVQATCTHEYYFMATTAFNTKRKRNQSNAKNETARLSSTIG